MKPYCPECGSRMRVRFGQYGRFYGCIRFPRCHGWRRIESVNRSPATESRPRRRRFGKANLSSANPVVILSVLAALMVGLFGFIIVVAFAVPGRDVSDRSGTQRSEANSVMPKSSATRATGATAGASSSVPHTLDERRAYAKNLPADKIPVCPKCGKKMVVRFNHDTGEPFFGCSDFPSCRGTRNVEYPK